MIRIYLILGSISAALYILFSVINWFRHPGEDRKKQQLNSKLSPAYFWGLLFASVSFYGFLIWWWRYGFRNCCKLILSFILMVAVTKAFFQYTELIDIDGLAGPFWSGQLISVPMRVLAGILVAKNDKRWRDSIIRIRNAKRSNVASDA